MSISAAEPYKNLTVLVVDDDSVHRKIVRRALQQQLKVTVHEANGGRNALQQLRQSVPDLILLDISMHDIDGDAVLNRVRKEANTSDVPVIMCTADNQPATINRLLAMQISGYIVKPYKTELVIERVKAVFDSFLKPGS